VAPQHADIVSTLILISPRSVSSTREGAVWLWRPPTRVLAASPVRKRCIARAHAAPQARERRGVPRREWPPMREQCSQSRVPTAVATLVTKRRDIPRLEVASEHLDSLGYHRASRFLLGVTSGCEGMRSRRRQPTFPFRLPAASHMSFHRHHDNPLFGHPTFLPLGNSSVICMELISTLSLLDLVFDDLIWAILDLKYDNCLSNAIPLLVGYSIHVLCHTAPT
jgi:hypothetical protein